jgi:hydrogenase maturation protein HypF
MTGAMASPDIGVRIQIEGTVQGVGFRPWIFTLARGASLTGRVWNDAGGVTVEAFGDPAQLDAFVARLATPPMPAARVQTLRHEPIAEPAPAAFEIVASRPAAVGRPAIPADLATCDDCRRELRDAGDRRHGHAFVTCTRCGPRYTIATGVPYDRARTTMAGFAMCPACRREYGSPSDRRFHAEAIACPRCGPTLRLLDRRGTPLAGDPIAAAAALLAGGGIVAVKGLGGYHLACDATAPATVAALRVRKRRDAKPFAVMVADLDVAGRCAFLGDAERALLAAPTRPIVLVERRPGSGLADEVAPGATSVGLLLPYTPLHELLMAAVGRPLVMTSGNRSDEPMVTDDRRALHDLGAVADAFLVHDRPIANRCDDSVARVIAGRPVVLRRGRGWVPAALRVRHELPRPLLACGAHLKNAFCLAAGRLAWLGPHVGDLETDDACRDFEAMLARFRRFVGIAPEVVAHDLHPDYFTTRWATERSGLPCIGVQHHHAHVVAAMAEHGVDGPVLGLAWDGTGYGTDGTAWGGELLVADRAGFRRAATFRPVVLAGGDVAVREVWRLALAALDDAFDGAPPLDRLRLFADVAPARIAAVRAMIAARLHAVPAHGVGRWFDVFGALALAAGVSRYEGDVAVRFALAADAGERRPYAFAVAAGSPTAVDLRPALRAAVGDLLAGRPAGTVSGRFHATLAAAAAEVVDVAARAVGRLPVVLTGGCFQNPRLVADVAAGLAGHHDVLTHRDVPPNDGGVALGQAVIAAAALEGR